MPTRATRRCCAPGCSHTAGRTGRCDRCASKRNRVLHSTTPTKAARTPEVRRHRAVAVHRHRAEHGDWCPGYGVPAHPASDLTADDPVPIARGGDPMQPPAVLCRSCNGRKADRGEALPPPIAYRRPG